MNKEAARSTIEWCMENLPPHVVSIVGPDGDPLRDLPPEYVSGHVLMTYMNNPEGDYLVTVRLDAGMLREAMTKT